MRDIILAVFGITALLGLVSLLLPLARRLNVPYTVLLAVFGTALGLAVSADLGLTGIGGDFMRALRWLDLSANAFLYLFLPPLLFAAGLGINVRRLMDDVGPVIVLAVIAVAVCTLVVGFTVNLVEPGYGLVACLLLGAIVATTDSAAVVAIFRDIGAPARLSIIVEGESLFNDAAAIAIFVVLLGLLTGATDGGIQVGIATFFFGLIGGFAFGYLLARLFAALIGVLRDAVLTEITLTITLAYLTFVAAEAYLDVSGVIAVVTAAITLNSEGRTKVSPGAWAFLSETWRLIDFVATSFIFTLAAMKVPAALSGFALPDLWIIGTVFLATIAARALVLYGLMPALTVVNIASPISGSYKAVLVWGGLRGAVTVALALAVSENTAVPEDVRQFIMVAATGFVFMTLIFMAPTIRPLMSLFRLSALTERDKIVRDSVLRLARSRVQSRLSGVASDLGLSRLQPAGEGPEDPTAQARMGLEKLSDEERLHFGLVSLAGREHELFMHYFQTGIVDRRIAEMLRAQTDRMIDAAKSGDRGRYMAVAHRTLEINRRFKVALWFYHRFGFSGMLSRIISDRFEVLILTQLALRDLRPFVQSDLIPLIGNDAGTKLQHVLEERETLVAGGLEILDLQYPTYAAMLRAQYLERVALGFEHGEYEAQRDRAIISNEVFEDLEAARVERARKLEGRPTLDLGLALTSMLQQVPLLARFDEEALTFIGNQLTPRIATPGERVIHEGDAGNCMYFIVSGSVEVVLPGRRIRLEAGDFFGEMALLEDAPRNADVVAVGFCTLLGLSRKHFQRMLRANPAIRSEIMSIAAARHDEEGQTS